MNISTVGNFSLPDPCVAPEYPLTSRQRQAIWFLCVPQTILTVFLNIVILLTFLRSSELRRPQHRYFFNLALCDFLIGSTALPSRLTLDLVGCWPASPVFCRIYKIIDWTVTSEAACTMILIAHSRYRMLSRGVNFLNEETSPRVMKRILITWLFNLLLYVPVQFVDLYTGVRITGFKDCKTEFFQIPWLGNLYVILNNVVPPITVLFLYAGVALALRSRRRLKNQATSLQSVNEAKNIARRVREDRSHKQTRTMLSLTFAFLFTSVPCGVCSIVMFADNSLEIFQTYLFLLYWLYLNSFFNTIVYTSKVPALRTAVRRLFWLHTQATRKVLVVPAISIGHYDQEETTTQKKKIESSGAPVKITDLSSTAK